MSKGLTVHQKCMLIKAYRNGGKVENVGSTRGNVLERKGYGLYAPFWRTFVINQAGRRFARDGIQKE